MSLTELPRLPIEFPLSSAPDINSQLCREIHGGASDLEDLRCFFVAVSMLCLNLQHLLENIPGEESDTLSKALMLDLNINSTEVACDMDIELRRLILDLRGVFKNICNALHRILSFEEELIIRGNAYAKKALCNEQRV